MSTCTNLPQKEQQKSEANTIDEALKKISLFDELSEKTRKELLLHGKMQAFPKGHIVFMNEDKADWFYILEKGWVKLFRETLGGDEAVIDVLPPASIFGETSIFENGNYSYGAEIIEDARVAAFPLHLIEKEAKTNSDFSMSFLRHISGKGLAKDKEIELRSVQNAPQRIGCFLLKLCRNIEKKEKITIHLSWEKSLIAARLGMKPETFSRSLAKLQNDVGIEVRGPTITIPDIDALVKYTCIACSKAFPCDK